MFSSFPPLQPPGSLRKMGQGLHHKLPFENLAPRMGVQPGYQQPLRGQVWQASLAWHRQEHPGPMTLLLAWRQREHPGPMSILLAWHQREHPGPMTMLLVWRQLEHHGPTRIQHSQQLRICERSPGLTIQDERESSEMGVIFS
jgi:hypothetical protein